MIKAHAFILIRNSYTYLPIHLYVPDLIVEVSLQVPPPLFVEELTKDHYHEKVLPNPIRKQTMKITLLQRHLRSEGCHIKDISGLPIKNIEMTNINIF